MTPGPMRSGYAADRRGPMTRMGTKPGPPGNAPDITSDVTCIHPEVSDMAKKKKQRSGTARRSRPRRRPLAGLEGRDRPAGEDEAQGV